MGAILAIDQGTSGTKALVVSESGSVLSTVEKEIHPVYLSGGGVEQDPEELWRSVLETSHRAVEEAGVALDGVTITNQGESVLAWDPKTGHALSSIIVWQDSRASAICDELRQNHPGIDEVILNRTGLVLDPYFTAPKIAWLRRNVTREGVVTATDTWMLFLLTGEYVTDAATASRSLLVDLGSETWNREHVEMFGLHDEALPRILDNDCIVGTTREFGGEVPVAGIIVDQQGALIAESCLDAGQAKCTFGTGAFLLANSGASITVSPSGLSACKAWRTDGNDTYCYDGQVYTAASAVRWIQDIGLIATPAELDSVAKDGREFFIPGLAGLAAPWWRSKPSGALVNLALSTTRGSLVGAVLYGISANIALLSDLICEDAGISLESLRADGGLTRSRFLMQSVANLNQVPVEVYSSPHATPLGAVALCRKALLGGSLKDALLPWKPLETFEPQWAAAQAAEYKEEWKMNADRIAEGASNES